jgi:hypothetical protein
MMVPRRSSLWGVEKLKFLSFSLIVFPYEQVGCHTHTKKISHPWTDEKYFGFISVYKQLEAHFAQTLGLNRQKFLMPTVKILDFDCLIAKRIILTYVKILTGDRK